jgi:hypothetical protein
METRRWVLAGAAGLVAALGVGAYGASAAPTPARSLPARAVHGAKVSNYGLVIGPLAGRPHSSHPAKRSGGAHSPLSSTFISFAPLHDQRGETLSLTAYGCARNQQLAALYALRRGRAKLMHDYVGTVTGCHLNRTLTAGTLTVRWSTALRISVALTAQGTPRVRRVRVAHGCYETTTRARYLATGRFAASIHAARLGRIVRSRVSATVVNFVLPDCVFEGATGSLTTIANSTSGAVSGLSAAELRGDELEDIWGADETLGALAGKGEHTTLTFTETAHDAPTPKVTDTFSTTLTGAAAFTPAANLMSATLDFASPLSTGTLTFTAGIGCPPTIRAEDGTFTGTVTIHDPVLGRVSIDSALMAHGQLSVVDSDAYKCAPVNFGES